MSDNTWYALDVAKNGDLELAMMEILGYSATNVLLSYT